MAYSPPDAARPRPWPAPPSPNRGLARTALAFALLGFLTCGTGSVVGIFLGYLTRRRSRPGDADQRLGRAAIRLGWSGLAAYAVVTALLVAVSIWASRHPGGGHHHHFHH